MRKVARFTLGRRHRLVRNALGNLLFQFSMAGETKNFFRLREKGGICRSVRLVAGGTFPLSEWRMHHRLLCQRLDIFVAGDTELIGGSQKKLGRIRSMRVMARGALTCFKRRMLVGKGHILFNNIVAGPTQFGQFAGHYWFAVVTDFVTALAFLIGEGRMGVGADKFRLG